MFTAKRTYTITHNGNTDEVTLTDSVVNSRVTITCTDGTKGYRTDGASFDLPIELWGTTAVLHKRMGRFLLANYFITMNGQLLAGDGDRICSLARDKAKNLLALGVFTGLVTIGLACFDLDDQEKIFGLIPVSFVLIAGLCLTPIYILSGMVLLAKHKQ